MCAFHGGHDTGPRPSALLARAAYPTKPRCQIALSPPRPNTSIRSGPQDTADGSEGRLPPSDSHVPQVPVNGRCHNARSPPRANRSIRPDPQLDTSGDPVMNPPTESHAAQVV